MKLKRWVLVLCFAAATLPMAPLSADTVSQINAMGKKITVQRDAIVVRNDSSYVVFKHFELKDRRVEKVSLQKGSLPYVVDTSSDADRQQIVDTWKQFGFKATVTDTSGKQTRIWDAYIDFYPPGGRGSLLESVPAMTSFVVLYANGGGDEFKFPQIDHVDFDGNHLKITLRNGQTAEGQFVMPTQQPAEAHFLGITEHYNPASTDVFDFDLPFARIKSIQFER